MWSNDIALAIESILSGEEIVRVVRASDEIIEFFEGIIDQRGNQPRDDMLSALLAAEEEGDSLTHQELLGTADAPAGGGS
ncbi:MAG: hypothetical protein OXI24_15975 [Candidatus Poribacteria bacterium]|nr:hypothetical protein [Candidatus Poribacteria bacterium]